MGEELFQGNIFPLSTSRIRETAQCCKCQWIWGKLSRIVVGLGLTRRSDGHSSISV